MQLSEMDGSLRVKRKILLEEGVIDAIDEFGNGFSIEVCI